MTDRVELGAIAADLAGERSGRRAAALARSLAGTPRVAIPLDMLSSVPAWVRLDADARNALGRRAALLAIAPSLSRSVNGEWLRGLAAVAGEDTLDWAASQDAPQKLGVFHGHEVAGIAAGIVRAATPPIFRGFVAEGDAAIDPADAAALVERAMRP